MFEAYVPETARSYSNKVAFALHVAGERTFSAMIGSDAAYSKLRAHYKNDGTLKATLTAILAGIREKSRSHPRLAFWRKRHAEVSSAAAAAKTGVLTKDLASKYVCWSVIRSAAKRRAGNHDSLEDSLETLLLSFVTMIAPKRADYGDLGVNRGRGNRVLLPRAGGATLVLNEFKTARSHGEFREQLPSALTATLRASLKAWPRSHVFVNSTGSPMSPSAFGKFVTATMLKHVGKPVGVTMLRHIYISDVAIRGTPEQRATTARRMLHSEKEQKEYVILRRDGRSVCRD
jgi:hypothetical protein